MLLHTHVKQYVVNIPSNAGNLTLSTCDQIVI